MCPVYVSGLIGPGERKSIQPMAERAAPGDYDQLHHFVSAGVWDAASVETELLVQADKLVGGSDAILVIDDTTILKKGRHSVGVAPQYCSTLGKIANCQTLVSLTLARGEVPVMVERQDGLCAICERKPRVRLHVDHSHDTRMLRLLLCLTCNAGLGNFGDNPSWLRRAIDYLEIWRIIHARWLAAGRKPIPKKKISKRKKGKKTKCRPTSSLKKNPKPRD